MTKYFCDKCESEIDISLEHFRVEIIPKTQGIKAIYMGPSGQRLLCKACDPFKLNSVLTLEMIENYAKTFTAENRNKILKQMREETHQKKEGE